MMMKAFRATLLVQACFPAAAAAAAFISSTSSFSFLGMGNHDKIPRSSIAVKAATSSSPPLPISSTQPLGERTKRILDQIGANADVSGGAGSSISFAGLQAIDRAWEAVKTGATLQGPAPTFVREVSTPLPSAPEYDVIVAGGTLGIFMATALQRKGFRVCVVERGPLRGRTQEWNISRKELQELVEHGVLDQQDVDAAIGIDFNPIRVGFVGDEGPYTIWTRDVLHLGVYPTVLLERAKQRFHAAGGIVRDETPIKGVRITPNGAAVELEGQQEEKELTARLIIDCMGNQSPISRQARHGKSPDGICIVVGTCASGFAPENNTYADLLYSNTPIFNKGKSSVHYFWEAFPAASGPEDRTTYLFMYCDAKPERPSVLECFEDYWDLLPGYQGVNVDDLTFKRAVCNFFPTYKDSPLKTDFDRLCAIGDASGIQSPLSFGGFGSLSRHMRRVVDAFSAALETDSLSKEELRLINGYQPGVSSTWMMQRAMSVPVGKNPSPYFINKALINNFRSMEKLGDPVLKPFLQDVVQAYPLFRAMTGIMVEDFFNTPAILFHVGPKAFFGWFKDFFALVTYTTLFNLFKDTKGNEMLPPKLRYQWDRQLETWEFGSGLDYHVE